MKYSSLFMGRITSVFLPFNIFLDPIKTKEKGIHCNIISNLSQCHSHLHLLHFILLETFKSFSLQFSSVQFSHSVMSDSATPWTAAHQASLSITNSWSLLKLMSIKSVMPSSHLIFCRPLLLLPSIFPSIRVFSNE